MDETLDDRVGRRLAAGVLAGAAAGAAGVTALNATTYLDMALRGRPASRTPEDTVEKMLAAVNLGMPGAADRRENRVTGVGAVLGMATGVTVGALAGAARALGLRLPLAAGAVMTTSTAMVLANGPMTVLGVTDPRTWTRADWLSDVLPHMAFGLATSATLRGLLPRARRG